MVSLLLFAASGCEGVIGEASSTTGARPTGVLGPSWEEGSLPGASPSAAPTGASDAEPQPIPSGSWHPAQPGDSPADPHTAGPLGVRLLTRTEYENTTFALLGLKPDPSKLFPAESQAETGFSKVPKLDDVGVGAYLDAALDLASRASANLSHTLGCDPTVGNDEDCVRSFVTSFGQRAYRRPLTGAEVTRQVDFYRDQLKGALALSIPDAVELLIAALLESPYFLYRWELDSKPVERDGELVKLAPFRLASQLSYFLWASMPDDALFDAASNDELQTESQVEAQARRMLRDPKADETVAAFHEQWLGTAALPALGKSNGLYPAWNPELGAAMAEEIRRFTTAVVLHGDGRFETLLTSRSSFVNTPLAKLYGVPQVTPGTFAPTELPVERSGLLTLAGFLTARSNEVEGSPIFRGKFIRERLLCDPMSPPPPNIPALPAPSPNVALRERYSEHSKMQPCKSCHSRMDAIGFGLGNFDAIGAYHTMEGTFPIDASGTIVDLDGASPTFDGARGLVSLLTASEQVHACFAKEWFRYAFARRETAFDKASLDAAYAAFASSDFDIRELLIALSKSRSFRYRSVQQGEVLQ